MTYVQGFVIPVPHANKTAYLEAAKWMGDLFIEYGAARIVETWGVDVHKGEATDFFKAVQAEDGENIVFSWVEWPSKAVCDAAAEKMQDDERMQPNGEENPFDGRRLIYGGFEPLLELKAGD
ncbi:UNVERIFIED_CONTAM: hypothetical protein GTU68_032419 [Idotea baltica]|nr:hypothetical protein [Idotea baltica]